MEKHDEQGEQLSVLAEEKVARGDYTLFDEGARVITRLQIKGELCLVIANREGEAFVIDEAFEKELKSALCNERIT